MRTALKIILTVMCGISLLAIIAWMSVIRMNTTGTYPRGVYLMMNAPIVKGAMVIFCPPDTPVFHQAKERGYIGAGFCPGGTSYMIKKILATAHDRVEMTNDGVFVNGALLPNSKPMKVDLEGRALLPIKADITALEEHSVLLMSD